MSTTVRVSMHTRDRVSALATRTGRNMSQVIEDAVAEYERQVFWRAFEDGYQRLRPADRAALEADRRDEATSLSDGVE